MISRIIHMATSKTAAKGVLNVGILATSYAITFFLSALAVALFHAKYVPDHSITWPIYLQYGQGYNPFSLTVLGDKLPSTNQDYDISVVLSLPASPQNMNLGNFMIEVLMISSAASQDDAHLMIHATSPSLSALTLAKALPQDSLLFKSRRPALVPHRDPLAALVRRVMFLPWYAMSGSRSCMTVETTLAERIQFANRAQLPKVIFVDVQAGQTIQTYSASIKFVARMHGLRYLMYHYRAICYVVLTSLFWASSMGFMTVTWFIWLALAKLSPKRSLGDASGQNLPFDYKPGVCRDSGAPYLPIKQENEDESLAAVTEENTQKRDRHKVHIKVEEEEDDGSTAIKAEPDGNESFRKGHNTEKQDEMESLCSNGSAKTGGTSSGRSSNDGGSEIRQRLGRET